MPGYKSLALSLSINNYKIKEHFMKKVTAVCVTLVFVLASAAAVNSAAVKCKVTSVTNQNVVLNCGGKAGKLKIGEKVKVKTVSKRPRQINGC